MASSVTSSITENNLTEFKKYLDDTDSEIHQYVGENGIIYSYDTKFYVYTHDPDGELVNTDGSTLTDVDSSSVGTMGSMNRMMNASSNNFEELMPGKDGELISSAVKDNYDVLYGSWPEDYDEVILVLNENNEISATALYELGLLPSKEYKDLVKKMEDGEEIELETQSWDYEEICDKNFYLIPACDTYEENKNGIFESIQEDEKKIEKLLEDSAVELKITGVIRPKEDASISMNQSIGYTTALTDYIIDNTDESAVVKAQKEDKKINVLNGLKFSPSDEEAKIEDTKTYLKNLGNPDMASQMMDRTEEELAATLDNYLKDPDDEVLLAIYEDHISTGSYDDNMAAFGVVSLDAPSRISIYADSFEDKDAISDCIENYNSSAKEENKISYTDYVALLMSSVTTIINVISYVLIAFVAVSLVVSSIMIGIITYISVLERTKEIGILRAIGASKHNISQVFNAETFIIGLCSGLIGIGVTLLLLIPGNAIIHTVTGSVDVNAALPVTSAIILIVLSMILTLIGGLIPAKKAAKKDPVTALRTE